MKRIAFATLGILAFVGSSAQAHHGYAAFFDPRERTVAIQGTLEDLRYANPHLVMTIRTANARLYSVTWQAATWVEQNAGVTRSTFTIGDYLIVTGAPSREPASREVTRIREVRRPRDGWSWRSSIPFAEPS